MTARRGAHLVAAVLMSVALAGCGGTETEAPRQGLVLELLLDGDALDTSGNGYHGQVEGAAPAADRAGRSGMAYRFDGDDWIVVTPPPPLGDGELTVSLWARYDRGEFGWWNNCLLAQDDGDDGGDRRIIQLSTTSRSICWHRMGERDAVSPVPLTEEAWHHVVASFDGRRHRLYVDGLLHDSRYGGLGQHESEPLYLGRKGSEEWDFTFRGVLDDVRVYNRALSIDEVLSLYREDPAARRN